MLTGKAHVSILPAVGCWAAPLPRKPEAPASIRRLPTHSGVPPEQACTVQVRGECVCEHTLCWHRVVWKDGWVRPFVQTVLSALGHCDKKTDRGPARITASWGTNGLIPVSVTAMGRAGCWCTAVTTSQTQKAKGILQRKGP